MSHTLSITVRRVSPFEGIAWYWLWSGTLCLWLVPAAREVSPRFGWPPCWLVGAPLALLMARFMLSWARRWRPAITMRAPLPTLLMTPADVAAVALRLRSTATPALSPTTRPRVRRGQRRAAVALVSR